MFAPGDAVRVRDDWPEQRGPCHVRTPHYVRGATGAVERALGTFPDPSDLAFARPAAKVALYHVRFAQSALWSGMIAGAPMTAPLPLGGEDGRGGPPGNATLHLRGPSGDDVLIEIFAHWLEAV